MNKVQFNKVLQNIGSSSPNIFDLSVKLTNLYFMKYYEGNEHEDVKLKYADLMFGYILEFLSNSKKHTNDTFKVNTIENFMVEIKESSKNWREQIYDCWKKCLLENRTAENKTVRSLLFLNPKLSNNDSVKMQLGL